MKYFFGRGVEALKALRPPKRVLWLFDFDGTLAPIERHPRYVHFSPESRRLLRQLARRFPGRVGVLSGRTIKHLKPLVGIPSLLYGGIHGFELQGRGFRWEVPLSGSRHQELKSLATKWRPVFKRIPKLWIEDKDRTLCLHYGEVRRNRRRAAWQLMRKALREARKFGFRIQRGLNNVEILSGRTWDKGLAARWLQHRTHSREIFYVGDDLTDERVFRILGPRDVGVRVGHHIHSLAPYYLRRQSETRKLLQRIVSL